MKLRDILDIDFILLFSAAALTVCGILFIYSSSITSTGVSVSTEYARQMIWGGAGFVIAVVLAMVNYRRLYQWSIYFYLGVLALLVFTCFRGRVVNGARAWLGIGSFGIQPSEFAKITTILFLAWYLDITKRNSGGDFARFLVSCAIAFLPMLIILLQPDFGTSLVFIPILIVMTFTAGISLRCIFFLIACIALGGVLLVLPLWQQHIIQRVIPSLSLLTNIRFIAAALAILTLIFLTSLFGFRRYRRRYFYWIAYSAAILMLSLGLSYGAQKVLKEYQIMRLIVFLDPNVDPRGSGWNIIQSITAIGSGGLWGKGYLQGTQSHYRFLPQQSTDFIFSIFSEECGLAGGLIIFALFLLISLRFLRIMKTTNDSFGAYVVSGLAAMFIFHFLINVGMTMGIMPITGIPLLFMSYGGSSLVSAMTGVGLALSIYVHRFHRAF